MSETEQTKPGITKQLKSKYTLIDCDPHIMRVIRYMRTSDIIEGTLVGAVPPILLLAMEKYSPSYVGRGGFAPVLRLVSFIGIGGGFLVAAQNSTLRFYGTRENSREVAMDMREMVDKVKRGEPLYGKSELSEYMQGVSARNSRYAGFAFHMIPWFNFTNHNQHGVDTAKYYQQAERELEAERTGKSTTDLIREKRGSETK